MNFIVVLLRRFVRFFRRNFLGHFRHAPESWNDQYGAGHWSYLDGLAQTPRYAAIVGYLVRLKCRRILDVGCGTGLLYERIPPDVGQDYLGIDFSRDAIAVARSKSKRRTEFIVADANSYRPSSRFDAVVFNESLYYFLNPGAVFRRYSQYLTDGGVVIISMHINEARVFDWTALGKSHTLVASVKLRTAPRGSAWVCRVYRRKIAG